jgi:hypothetical protein
MKNPILNSLLLLAGDFLRSIAGKLRHSNGQPKSGT